ncbi:type VI secretion system baseplate subunit TssG [Campylobacterota bacterium DY0563]
MTQLEIINRDINDSIKKTTLPQAIRITCIYLKKFYPDESFEQLYKRIKFNSNVSLSFQKSEIDKINFFEYESSVCAQITLNFLGIFGSSSPLPSHYSEMVLNSIDEDFILHDFLNLFNHHLQKFVYPIWEKHRYYIQYKEDLSDKFSKYILSFLGLHFAKTSTSKLNLQKLIPCIGILSMKHKSAGTLKSILRHYLSHDNIEIIQCIPSKYDIPSWQQSSLGDTNISLGSDFLIGESIISKNLKFRILLKDIKNEEIITYSILGDKMGQIADIISFSLNEPLEYEVSLEVKKEEKNLFILENEERSYLGINSWIGNSNFDEEIIMV